MRTKRYFFSNAHFLWVIFNLSRYYHGFCRNLAFIASYSTMKALERHVMRKFTFSYKAAPKQNYSCVTIKELEELLGKEETTDSKISKILNLILQWKRLFLGIFLIWILIYAIVYLAGLKKEITLLRGESAGLRQDILNLREENADLRRELHAKQPPESPVAEEADEAEPPETQLSDEFMDEEYTPDEETNTPAAEGLNNEASSPAANQRDDSGGEAPATAADTESRKEV